VGVAVEAFIRWAHVVQDGDEFPYQREGVPVEGFR
jgi:hypothetical protein